MTRMVSLLGLAPQELLDHSTATADFLNGKDTSKFHWKDYRGSITLLASTSPNFQGA